MKEPKLKPCPFCGVAFTKFQEFKSFLPGMPHWGIVCTDCGATVSSYGDKEIVVAKWNRRAGRRKK